MFGFFKQFREAWRIVRIYRDDDYDGPFVVIPEEAMRDIQKIYGRALAENKQYQVVLEKALDGLPVCEDCEDYEECKASDDWPKESFSCFMLKFPTNREAEKAFNCTYSECNNNCRECGGHCHEDN